MKRNTPIPRLKILKAIGDQFQQMIQWGRMHSYGNVAEAQAAATSLIELLEVHDCGSVGGFDAGFDRPRTLVGRWDWLYRKYNNPTKKRFGCNIVSYEEICEHFDFVPKKAA